MKLRLWEHRPRTARCASLTGVASDEAAGDIPAAVRSTADSGVDHADSEHSAATDNDECCALLRGEPVRRSPFRLRQRRNWPEH
jgi:hypothetical protein